MTGKKFHRNWKKVLYGCAAGALAMGVIMSAAEGATCRAESTQAENALMAEDTQTVGTYAEDNQAAGKQTAGTQAEDNQAAGKQTQGAQAENTQAQTGADSPVCLNIASVSKMYVTTAVMQLADQGKIDLDAPVTDYITDFSMADERYRKITVRMLMNHTSGLMGTVYGGQILFDEENRDYHDAFLKHLRNEKLKYEPGIFNCYCNDGFTLLEILTERVSKMSFTDYLEEYICRPLSLGNTGTMWNVDRNRIVPVFVNGNVKMPAERDQSIGAGGVISTAEDVCNFGTAFFKGNEVLLSEKAKAAMAMNECAGESRENFGLGWDEVTKKDYEKAGVTVLSKGGDCFYHHSSLVVAPDLKISAAVLSSGGGSGLNEEMALELLDIALSEQGISIEHPEKTMPELTEQVPEEYLFYEGLYADMQRTVRVTFPEGRYLSITSVTSDLDFERQYLYAEGDCFVEMSGDIASGKAIPVRPVSVITFEEQDGQIYIADPAAGCGLYKASENNVSEKVQNAWDQRNDVSYYLVNGSASDAWYSIENCCCTLHTSEAAKGYVNGYVMLDEDHAGFQTIIPGSASRDLSNLQVEHVSGKEYLNMYEYGYRYLSEEYIPVLTEELAGVDLQSQEACWFKIENMKNATLRFELPEKAAAYVYDQYGSLRYSSYMTGYGKEVPLPENGMIVFIGETGDHVNISFVN